MKRSELRQSLLLNPDMLELLAEACPSIKDGCMHRKDIGEAMSALGFPLAGYEVRDLISTLPTNEDPISLDTFMMLQAKVKEQKDFGRTFSKKKGLIEKSEDNVDSADGAISGTKHTVSPAEERGYTEWINRSLQSDLDLVSHLPIRCGSSTDLYDRCKDGLILCKLINKAVPDTIDERALNKGKNLKSVFQRSENLVLAVNSAEAIGCCVVNIGAEDIEDGTRHLVLGLIWQIIRNGLLGMISLTHHSELVALLRPGETLDDLRQLTPEELLIRWVNYQLEKTGIDRRINNFKDDIMDSEVYANLLNQIAPGHLRTDMTCVYDVTQPCDLLKRAELVLDNANVLDARVFLTPEDIAMSNERGKNREKLNLAFVAYLFNNYPAMEVPADVVDIPETLEEKTYRNWMNSLGVNPYVTDLNSDLRNGLVLLQVMDILQPGMVDWKKITRVFDRKRKLFQMQANCTYVIQYAKQLNLKVVNLSGEDIREGDKKLTLGLCFQLMRCYTLKMLTKIQTDGRPIEESHIVEWTNQKLSGAGKASRITGFKDSSIATAKPIIDLVDAIHPNSVDYTLVTGDLEIDAKFAISMARKIGARVYALPQHIMEVNQKMVMTIFACMMVRDCQRCL